MTRLLSVLLVCSLGYSHVLAQETEEDSTRASGILNSIIRPDQPRIGGLIQFWTEFRSKGGPGGKDSYYDSFRIRRVELNFSGMINEKINYGIMVDFARSISNSLEQGTISVLQDVFVELSYIKGARIKAGQFKYPLTYEGLISSSRLDFVERAEITRIFGDKRDIGIRIAGDNENLDYAVGVVNGNSQNKIDQNRDKDIVGRLVFKPSESVSFGGSAYIGRVGSKGETPFDRAAAEFVYRNSTLHFASEFVWAREATSGVFADMKGFYASSLYRIDRQTELGFRYEYADKNLELAKGVPKNRFTVGLNRSLDDGHEAKVQLNFILTEDRADSWNNLAYINLQIGL